MIPARPFSQRACQCFLTKDGGSALVEMAVTLPVLFTLMFCFMQMCLAFYTVDMISESAREGTRWAMYRGATCPTSTNPTCEASASQVNSYVSGIDWPNLAGGTVTVTTTYPNGNEAVGSTVQVKVSYTMPITMPFVPKNSMSFSSTSVMPILQ
jgi:Flp pilus assembly protein TadG